MTPQQIEPVPGGPVILTSPQPLRVLEGSDVLLDVFAVGDPPLTYQWNLDDTPLPGATASSLSLAQVRLEDAGDYSVTVTNKSGSASSLPAALTVLVPPVILEHPEDQIAEQGQAVSFSVTASGNAPLNYFWVHNGQLLREERASTLNLSGLQPSDAGEYSVYVQHLTSDGPVSIRSMRAVLTVVKSP
jgi:hypothetical protein